MSDHTITHAQLREAMGDLKAFMRDRFDQVDQRFCGIDERLDRVNGRLDKHEGQIGKMAPDLAAQQTTLSALSNEVFDRRSGRRAEPNREPDAARAGHGHETLTVSISPKLWSAIYLGGGAVGVKLIEWPRFRPTRTSSVSSRRAS
jgi:hypothetical protein